MTKIRINCGGCGKAKGCEAKKKFRDLAKTIDVKYDIPFTLRCPLKERKYKEGQGLKATIGINSYYKKTVWDCDWCVDEGHTCEGCRNEEICNDGEVIFSNLVYRQYIEVIGTLENNYKTNMCVIRIKKDQLEGKGLNKEDIKRLNTISNNMNPNHTLFENQGKYMFIVSKEKYTSIYNEANYFKSEPIIPNDLFDFDFDSL